MKTIAQIEEYMHARKLEFDARYLQSRQLTQPELLRAWQDLQIELELWVMDHKRTTEKVNKMRRKIA